MKHNSQSGIVAPLAIGRRAFMIGGAVSVLGAAAGCTFGPDLGDR